MKLRIPSALGSVKGGALRLGVLSLGRSQAGLTLILNVFFIGLGVTCLAVLGAGQVMFEKSRLQKLVDTTALEAARQLSDGPNFDSARNLAQLNGADEAIDLTLTCLLNEEPAPDQCAIATEVRVQASRQLLPFFTFENTTITAIAQARLAPLITGQVRSGLLTVNTQQSQLLNGLFTGLGLGEVSLSALSWQGLLGSSVQVPLVDLALELDVTSLEEFANLNVSALDLINAALNVSSTLNPTELPTLESALASVAGSLEVNIQDVLALDLAGSTQGVAEIELGQLIYATLLGAVSAISAEASETSNSLINIPISLPALGIDLDVQLVEPPRVFVGRKTENKFPIVTAETAQARIAVRVGGLQPTTLGLGGLANVRLSAINFALAVETSGGSLQVNDIGCRFPRAENTVDFTVSPSLARVCLGSVEEGQACEAPANLADLRVTLLGSTLLNAPIEAQLNLGVMPGPSNVQMVGLPPQSVMIPTSLGESLGNALPASNIQLFIGGNTSAISTLTSQILSATSGLLTPVLAQVGNLLDNLLIVLGASVNDVRVDINTVDCKSSILTR